MTVPGYGVGLTYKTRLLKEVNSVLEIKWLWMKMHCVSKDFCDISLYKTQRRPLRPPADPWSRPHSLLTKTLMPPKQPANNLQQERYPNPKNVP